MPLTRGGIRFDSPESNKEPIASIITVVYNGIAGIEKTVSSVLRADRTDFEYIVIDGGSADGTADFLRSMSSSIDYWVSEKDSGIYDAINKGIRAAQGKFFLILNIGDTLLEFPGKELQDAFSNGTDVALFNVEHSDGKIISSQIDYRIRFGNTIHHQGAFYSRALNIQYDLRYKVFSDFNTNQLLFLAAKKFVSYPTVISRHDLDGISNDKRQREEYFEIISKNFGLFWSWIGRLYIWQGELRKGVRNDSTASKSIG